MMKITKKIVIISLVSLFVLLLLTAGAVFIAVKSLGDVDKYKTKLFENIQKSSGYSLYAEKVSLKPVLKPYLPVNIHRFIVYSPEGEKMFKSTDIDFKISLLPLLKKNVKIYEVSLNRPVIEFDINAENDVEIDTSPIEYNGFNISYDVKNLILNRYKFNIFNGNKKYALEGDRIDISNSDQKNSVRILTQGVLSEEAKELLNYDILLETPMNILNKKQKDSSSKKYIKANITAQKIALGTLREVYGALFKLCGIKTPLLDYKITGTGTFDFDVESDFKTLKSKGVAEIENGEIKHKSIPFNVQKINSKINFENNTINIENAKAFINNNPITLSGKINDRFESDILLNAEGLELKNIFPMISKEIIGDYSANSGVLDFKAALKGKNANDYVVNGDVLIKKLGLSDKLTKLFSDDLKVKFQYSPKKQNYDISSDKVDIKLDKHNFSINKIAAKYDGKDLGFSPSKLNYNNCSLDVEGGIKNVFEKNRELDFTLQGAVNASDLAVEAGKYFKFQSASKGKLPIFAKINGIGDKTKISAKINSDKDNYLSALVIKELLNKPSMLSIIAELNGKDLKIDNISLLNLENIKGLNNFKFTVDKAKKIFVSSGVLNLGEKVSAQDLKIQIPDSMTFSTGLFDGAEVSVKGDITVNGDLNNPKIKGGVILNKLNLLKHNVIIQNADLNFLDNIIKVNIPNLVLEDSQFNLAADVLPKFGEKLYIKYANVSSSKLNLRTLTEMFSDVKTSDIFPGIEVPVDIESGVATINRFSYDYINLNDVTTDFMLRDNVLKLTNAHAGGFDGTIRGNIDFNFLMQILNLDVNGTGINTNKIIQALTDIPSDLTGRTEFEAKLQIKGTTKEQQIKALRGTVKFITNEGQLGILGQFERYLQAQNLLHLGFDNLKREDLCRALKTHNTSYFRRAEGQISFENGYALIDSFKTQGKVMSLLIGGKFNMLNESADLNLLGKISDEIFTDEIVVVPYVNDEIPDILSPNVKNPRGFKVDITGSIDNIRSINSFEWLDSVKPVENDENENIESSSVVPQNYDKYPSFLNDI